MTPEELRLVREKVSVGETVARLSCSTLRDEAEPLEKKRKQAARMAVSTDEDRLNKLERAFLQHLRADGYIWIGIQCITLKLAFDTRYTPDLWTHGQWGLNAWEVKGPHAWEDSLVKLKVAARLFPMIQFTLVRRSKNGQWEMQDIKP